MNKTLNLEEKAGTFEALQDSGRGNLCFCERINYGVKGGEREVWALRGGRDERCAK